MRFEEIDVKSLIPQQVPFVMVDKMVHYDSIFTRTEFEIKPENIFIEEGKLLEAGLIENIAQTCAVRLGYVNTHIQNNEVRLGFIGALKALKINKLPEVNSILETTIEVVNEVFNITLVNASTRCRGEEIVSCEMKISIF
jgi:predicted hotdog family 3-hydroxylacyl-ACP dehydratase